MSTCDPSSPSVSFVGKLERCTARASSPYPVSFTLRDAKGFSCHNESVAAGATITVTPSPSPANMILIDTPRAIEIQLNNSTTWLRVDRLFLATMTVTTVDIRNTLETPPLDIAVEIYFAQGTVV